MHQHKIIIYKNRDTGTWQTITITRDTATGFTETSHHAHNTWQQALDTASLHPLT